MTFRNRFTSRLQGQNSAKKFHMCLSCLHSQTENWGGDPCPGCGARDMRQVFSSKIERDHGAQLVRECHAGEIKDLKFQHRFPLKIEGDTITTYVADMTYTRLSDGKFVVEHVKPKGRFMDPLAKIKIALFNAIHKPVGLAITIIRK